MCGILGVISLEGAPIDLSVLQRMNDLQLHRGPDGEGFLLSRICSGPADHTFVRRAAQCGERDVQVALGHRRLAIIDLSDRGLQPMTVGDGQMWIVYNGEIYNHRELRSELESHGFFFTTRTDTEVLLQAYRHWGEDCLTHLEGMFAFAIWDGQRNVLFCARDRFGIKPFYYTSRHGFFVFASEMKALLAFPGVKTEADDDAVLGFLVHGNCDGSYKTLLRDVLALPAAHCLSVDAGTGRLSTRKYYRLEPRVLEFRSDEDGISELRDLLLGTINRHLISDVRAGSCLSGGLDSSTVVSLIGEICRDKPQAAVGARLHTFTSCYENREFDERQYAITAAGAVGAQTELVFPSAEDFWQDFERLAWHQDMPFGGLSFYAQWRVMRAASEAGVKVLLDGQGGDEVFGGYAKFRYAYLASLLRSGRLPTLAREFGAMLSQGDRYVLNLRTGYRYLPRQLRSLLNVDSLLKGALRADLSRAISDHGTPATRWWRNASALQAGTGQAAGIDTIMQRIQLDDIQIDTLPQLLRLEDRSSMAFSIEARVPLLDHRLVEYGVSLPDDLKVRGGWSKYALREALKGLMPETVRLRTSKLGFAAPDRIWLSRDLRARISEMIGGELRCQKYVDPAAIRRWYNSTKAATANTESYLGMFRIISLETWMRVFKVT
jgi:asparagine synthase (glutamine-hydrolysing)